MNKHVIHLSQALVRYPARFLMGKGLDKHFPAGVNLYKRMYARLSGDELVETSIPLGKKLWVRSNDAGLGLMLRCKGAYEPVQTAWWLKTIKPGMVVVDIGANVGYYSVLAAELMQNQGVILSVEPEPENFSLLVKNTVSCGVVKPIKAAVGDRRGLISLDKDLANPGETRINLNNGQILMQTLDELMEQQGLKTADVAKIDVEGAEPLVLRGLVKHEVNALVCECNPKALGKFGFTVADLLQALGKCDLEIREIVDERAGEMVAFTLEELNKRLEKSSYVSLIARK